jgi:hypothetical protein
LVAFVLAGSVAGCAPAGLPSVPPLYLGLAAYQHWDKLPYLEIGDRAEGESTADPAGSNNDRSHVLGVLPDGGRVLFDQTGPGVATFLRMQQRIGAPWRLSVDGGAPITIDAADLGRASSTWPYPLSLNTAQTQGSSVVATQLPFAKSLRLTSAGQNGNFYALYRKLPIDAALPPEGLTAQATALLNAAGTDIAPANLDREQGTLTLRRPGTEVPVTTIAGSRQIRAITFHVPSAEMARFGNARLKISWDGEPTPSVDAPVKYLVGDGAGVYQPQGRNLVQALPSTITAAGSAAVDFSLYWPMPFTTSARVSLVAAEGMSEPVSWSIRHEPFTDPPNWVGKFHANYTDIPSPRPGADMTFLDFRGSGKLVGTVVNFGAVGTTLEGDPRIYLDGSRTPQIAVTGTEEWGLGGDYWNNGAQTTLPLGGLPSATNNPAGAEVDGAAEYRFLIADAIPFNNRIVLTWEHGPQDDSTRRYRATMLWYATPVATAIPTDQHIPTAAPRDRRYPLTSGYGYTLTGPQLTDPVVATRTETHFTAALRGDNVGAFLRRTFDSCVGNQRADVYLDGNFAGTWYNPGTTTGRCWSDNDFPLPKTLTADKQSVTIRIVPIANEWTAARYQTFSFIPA